MEEPQKPADRKQRGRPFTKGQSGNPRGRKRGVPNKATTAAKEACAAIVDDAVYREHLLEAARRRELAPAVEVMLWHYAKGKPKDTVEHVGLAMSERELSLLTNEELKREAARLVELVERL